MKVTEIHGFRVNIPDQFGIGERGKAYAESQGDVSVEITSCGANAVLVYRKWGQWPLELEPITQLLTDINTGSYEMETVIDQVKSIQFDGKPAIQLSGYWIHEIWGRGPLKAIGVQCGDHFFVIEAAVNGPWDPELEEIAYSFEHCET